MREYIPKATHTHTHRRLGLGILVGAGIEQQPHAVRATILGGMHQRREWEAYKLQMCAI